MTEQSLEDQEQLIEAWYLLYLLKKYKNIESQIEPQDGEKFDKYSQRVLNWYYKQWFHKPNDDELKDHELEESKLGKHEREQKAMIEVLLELVPVIAETICYFDYSQNVSFSTIKKFSSQAENKLLKMDENKANKVIYACNKAKFFIDEKQMTIRNELEARQRGLLQKIISIFGPFPDPMISFAENCLNETSRALHDLSYNAKEFLPQDFLFTVYRLIQVTCDWFDIPPFLGPYLLDIKLRDNGINIGREWLVKFLTPHFILKQKNF